MSRVDGPVLMTQAEYARSRKARGLPGGSREAVRKAVDAGRISAMGPDKLVDPAVADIQWAANTRGRVEASGATQSPSAQANAAGGGDGGSPANQGTLLAGGDGGTPAAPEVPAVAPKDTTYQDARARREVADAAMAEIEAAKMAKKLATVDGMHMGWREAFQTLRDIVFAVPASCAPEVVGLTEVREVQLRMERDLRAAFAGWEAVSESKVMARLFPEGS